MQIPRLMMNRAHYVASCRPPFLKVIVPRSSLNSNVQVPSHLIQKNFVILDSTREFGGLRWKGFGRDSGSMA